jgi:hypothetical protein
MEGQLRRYFFGLVAFGFVACWSAAGIVTAASGVAACVAVVAGPRLLKRKPRRQRPVRTRPLRTDSDLPLVPDEPSLIVELG